MSDDDYLFDPSAEPDPDVQRLERLLAPHRYAPPRAVARKRRRPFVRALAFAAAAAALVALGVTSASLLGSSLRVAAGVPSGSTPQPWWSEFPPHAMLVTRLHGRPRIGDRRVDDAAVLAEGEWIETDAASRARVDMPRIGQLELAPRSRLRLLVTGEAEQRLELAFGELEAHVVAPPRIFVVALPSATAIDLGCAYRLRVDERGAELRVTSGWVELDGARKALVPAGASCRTRAPEGPGTPAFVDAPPALLAALESFDFDRGGDEAARAALRAARRRDALSVWHLLSRTTGALRHEAFVRLADLVPPPGGLAETDVDDRARMDAWRDLMKIDW